MNTFVYIVGLIIVAVYLLLGIDDLVWDIATAFKKNRSNRRDKLPMQELDAKAPRLLAIIVAAWHEDAVIGPVIENVIASVQYPRDMYHIFLGVYPNDPATIAAVEELERKFPNVHMVVNVTPGPTCKADNVNNVLRQIRAFEQRKNWRFASVTVHDSEDVVHAYEFKVTNYLIDEYDALQFPVFPLQEKPKLGNILRNMTSGTYADEFAENHFRTLVLRDESGAVVPSAGTGFVLSRRVLESFGDEDVFPKDSLTEDYKLSLTLAQKGFRVHYVLERVRRMNQEGKLVWDYISTRSMFPATYSAAVRQKTRWIYGITMQSFKMKEFAQSEKIGFAGRYSLYKDLKAKFGNLIVLPGYLVFVYFIVSLFVPLPVIYPVFTLSWWLCMLLTAMMVERQILRAIAIKNVYGWRSVVVACLLPPVMPVRLVWGNIINLSATLRAWKQYFVGTRQKSVKKQKWSKTDHEFLEHHILRRYHRNLGDVLLEKGFVDEADLDRALQIAKERGVRTGQVLLENGWISEGQMLGALANVQHTLYLPNAVDFIAPELALGFERSALEHLRALPLLKTETGYVYALSDNSPADAKERLGRYGDIQVVYARESDILRCIGLLYTTFDESWAESDMHILYDHGFISAMQALLARVQQRQQGAKAGRILDYMGLRASGIATRSIAPSSIATNDSAASGISIAQGNNVENEGGKYDGHTRTKRLRNAS